MNQYWIMISAKLSDRWDAYKDQAPAWQSLSALVESLLLQHFDEADTIQESIRIQEAHTGK